MVSLIVNGKTRNVEATPDTPLLWCCANCSTSPGTKFAAASPCAVPARCTSMGSPCAPARAVSAAAGKRVTTVEADRRHALRKGRCRRLDPARRARSAATASRARS